MEHQREHARFFALHAHFYQPPRENPWTGRIDPQPSAWPFHDWNSRIARECYLPNACARVNDASGRVLELTNNYLHLNFNFGPTLFSWLEKHYPFYYSRIVAAARESRERTGHSNAIAQAYNHLIMPLASFQDRLTQALWGIKDYEARFGFRPEAMWLPETAANDDTLRLLIDLGMKYAILSPYQADKVREPGGEWKDASRGDFDTTRPYVWRDPLPGVKGRDRSIALFFYDGPLSKAAAFEGLTRDSGAFADRVEACFRQDARGPQLVSMAVDGETFGHHHKFAELTLAHAFLHELRRRGIQPVSFGAYLEKNPPSHEALLKPGPDGEGTAWSCAHGVRRWKGGCDCGGEGGSLAWRLPLRAALNALRDAAADVYAAEGAKFFKSPWEARNDYAALLLDRSAAAEDAFFGRHSARPLDKAARARALELLEMQKHAMFMFTSCGWFFADVSRIEAVQNLRYAARVAETLRDLGFESADKPFLSLLEMARSNFPEHESALKLYQGQLAENALARQKAAALTVAGALLGAEDCRLCSPVTVEERRSDGGVLALRGKALAPGPLGDDLLPFCYVRRGAEFPALYFPKAAAAARLKELFSSEKPGGLEAALAAEPGFAKVTFEDLSWEERTLYAWILADAARHAHAGAIFKVLEDYLYLLARLPGRTSSSWAPLRAQASAYARQAAEILFTRALRSSEPGGLRRLAELAARFKEAGLESGFDPSPEDAAELAGRTAGAALAAPSSEQALGELLHLLRAARDLGAHDLLFHLQNYLSALFAAAAGARPAPGAADLLRQLYGLSGLIVERFNVRLEELSAAK